MRILLSLLLFILLVSETCKEKKERKKTNAENAASPEQELTDKIPACIQLKIDSIKKQPRYNPPAEVNEYRYNDKRVFLFTSDCCDNFNLLFDNNCNYVCAATGGITGKGDLSCTDFTEKAKHIKLIWKDER
jgi:hypothetical protein